jgi:hypothetical protein
MKAPCPTQEQKEMTMTTTTLTNELALEEIKSWLLEITVLSKEPDG